MENDFYEINVTNTEGEKLTLKIHWESDAGKWGSDFQTIMKWIGFAEDTIKETVRGEYDEEIQDKTDPKTD